MSTLFKKFPIIFIFSQFLISQQPILKLYLSFDEGDGTEASDKGSGLIATLNNCEWVQGVKGKALLFNGKDSYVRVQESQSIDFLRTLDGPFTMEAWFRPSKFFEENYRQTAEIINTGSGRGPGYRIIFSWRMVYFTTGDGQNDWYISTKYPQHKIELENWNHIAVVRNTNNILIMYFNGNEASRSTNTFQVTDGNRDITIGSYYSTAVYMFQGVIDEVKIFQGAKTAAEIMKSAR